VTAPTRTLRGWRFVAVRHSDTLQSIALRELGNADRWRDLIAINDLAPPYITNDPAQASPRVLGPGDQLRVPAATASATSVDDPTRIFGVDLKLTNGRLSAENGDFATVSGVKNLDQAIVNRIQTPTGRLAFHPDYGCKVHELLGEKNLPTKAALGAAFVRGSLLNDPRISNVPSVSVRSQADALPFEATVQPITGSTVDVQTSV
jgi:phage baseplate assembly protein W